MVLKFTCSGLSGADELKQKFNNPRLQITLINKVSVIFGILSKPFNESFFKPVKQNKKSFKFYIKALENCKGFLVFKNYFLV